MKTIAAIALGAALSALAPGSGLAQSTIGGLEGAGDTLKERLSDKASDSQRVDDCKVPVEKRGNSTRSAECGPSADAEPVLTQRAARNAGAPVPPVKTPSAKSD